MLDHVLDRLSALGDVRARRMFGGAGVYAGATMFGIVYDGAFYLKTDEAGAAEMSALGARPFAPRKGMTSRTYREVPAEILDDDEALTMWARRAIAAGRARAASARPTRVRRTVTPEEILKPHAAPVRALANELRTLVREAAPHAKEAGYAGWKLIGYRGPHYFCFVAPQKDHVRLGFEQGRTLKDPAGILEGDGTQVRYVRVQPGRRIPKRAIKALVAAAAQKRRA